MIFTGHAELTIDPKQRLAIPAKYRAQLEQAGEAPVWYCIPWDGHGLMLYPEKKFEELAGRHGESLFPVGEQADLQTDVFGLTERLEMDSAGRITIPRRHLELTGLANEVVVIGSRYRLDVKDRAAWSAGMGERFKRLPVQAQRLEMEFKRPDGAGQGQ